MNIFVMTDLEGVVGVDSFTTTRAGQSDHDPEAKADAMDRLAAETNALVEGIRSRVPSATIDVYDGHGSNGLRESDLDDANWYRDESYQDILASRDFDGVCFVGQHAMAGTAFAPLRHTLSSTDIAYFKISGTFVGEFGGIAIEAGLADTPVIFLAGDDKATLEAEQWVPEIESVAVKAGHGVEAATHRDPDTVLDDIRAGAAQAIDRRDAIPPVTGFEPPFESEVRYYEPESADRQESIRRAAESATVERVDARTVTTTSETYGDVYP